MWVFDENTEILILLWISIPKAEICIWSNPHIKDEFWLPLADHFENYEHLWIQLQTLPLLFLDDVEQNHFECFQQMKHQNQNENTRPGECLWLWFSNAVTILTPADKIMMILTHYDSYEDKQMIKWECF